jgi:hypothetical protein
MCPLCATAALSAATATTMATSLAALIIARGQALKSWLRRLGSNPKGVQDES